MGGLIPDPATLALVALATYYVALTTAKLHGPFGLAERFRHAVYHARGFVEVGSQYEPGTSWKRPAGEGRAQDWEDLGDDWVASGVRCPLCLSLYVAPVLLGLTWLPGGTAVVACLGLAGAASWLYMAAS